jgi:hypothetical protein
MGKTAWYWGYLLVGFLVAAWVAHDRRWWLILLLSVLVLGFGLFRAPAPCGAPNRKAGTFCRNNAYGLLMGCHVRAHRWEKLKMLVFPTRWRELAHRCLTSGRNRLAALASVAASISTILALVATVRKM